MVTNIIKNLENVADLCYELFRFICSVYKYILFEVKIKIKMQNRSVCVNKQSKHVNIF